MHIFLGFSAQKNYVSACMYLHTYIFVAHTFITLRSYTKKSSDTRKDGKAPH
mgnify:FL=1